MHILCKIFYGFLILVLMPGNANGIPVSYHEIHTLIEEGKLEEAEKLLLEKMTFLQSRSHDSIATYIPLMGRLYLKKGGPDKAADEIEKVVKAVRSASFGPEIQVAVMLKAAAFYAGISRERKAYEAYEKAGKIAGSIHPPDYNLRAKIENNLAVSAYRMNDMPLSSNHNKAAERFLRKSGSPDFGIWYNVHNTKASVFYFAYQLDSAEKYYMLALSDLEKSDKDTLQKQFSEAVLYNNLARIYGIRDEKVHAEEAMRKTIEVLTDFMAFNRDLSKQLDAGEFLYEAIDNLAGIYKSLGDYNRAYHLLRFAYEKKQQELPKGNNGIFKSEILLGQALSDMGDLKPAAAYLQRGLKNISVNESDYLFWEADALASLAHVYEQVKEYSGSALFYNRADSVYSLALGKDWDNIYLGFLNKKAMFLARSGQSGQALITAQKSLKYVLKQEGENSSMAAGGFNNLAEISLLNRNYEKAGIYSRKALDILNKLLRERTHNLRDSISLEMEKPAAILLKEKAFYLGKKTMEPAEIDGMTERLSQVQKILERRMRVLSDEGDWKRVQQVQQQILDFINQLNLEKYKMQGDEQIIHDIVQTHESGVYKRIRNNINRQKFIKFSNVPEEILETERTLKMRLAEGPEQEKEIKDFFRLEKEWEDFQEKLRSEYPGYYKARYSTDDNWSESELWKNLPTDMTVIKYLFLNQNLYAFILQREQKHWVDLGKVDVDNEIIKMSEPQFAETEICAAAYWLYQKLWAPLAAKIQHKRVMIIPDKSLYHLSFELLSEADAESFAAMQPALLVNKYAFSYHYSLLAAQAMRQNPKKNTGFIAFTPAFSDEEKDLFRQSDRGTDFAKEDEYRNLLPLPFSVLLARESGKIFGGKVYGGVHSTKENFVRFSSGHSIVYIGTHAVANDEFPEYSKLIFARDPARPEEDHHLYLYDLYSYDLSSDITVLTACETGKSKLFPGEGMISMAHAFMFAGSKSILTGLWKIDEQMTTRITASFYRYLRKGWPKDLALQQAKLEYLSENKGRLLHPQYWAGLALMGDVSPLSLSGSRFWRMSAVVVFVMIGLSFLWVYYKKSS